MPTHGEEQAEQRENRDALMDEEKMQHGLPPEAEGEEIDPAHQKEGVRESGKDILRGCVGFHDHQTRPFFRSNHNAAIGIGPDFDNRKNNV